MRRGCLFSLGLFVLLWMAYYNWFVCVFDWPANFIGAGVASFLALCCLGALTNARLNRKYCAMLSVAKYEPILRDGRLVAVCGKIYPLGEPLQAPFSGANCVICEYDLTRRSQAKQADAGENPGSDYAGFLMTPSVIRSPFGDVRIIGYPILDGFDDVQCNSAKAARNGREFLQNTEFKDQTGLKFVGVLTVFGKIWHDDDGQVDVNFRLKAVDPDKMFPPGLLGDLPVIERWETAHADVLKKVEDGEIDEEDDEEGEEQDVKQHSKESFPAREYKQYSRMTATMPRMTEKRVAVGEDVCAVGIYQEALRGLSPIVQGKNITQLIRGDADDVIRASRKRFRANLKGGVIGLIALHAAIFGIMQIYLHNPQIVKERERAVFEAVRQENLEDLETLAQRKRDFNIRDLNGYTPLMLSKNAKISRWLVEHGANVNDADKEGATPLMMAVANGRTEVVKVLLAAGADVSRTNNGGTLTALKMAQLNGHADVVELLTTAEAK